MTLQTKGILAYRSTDRIGQAIILLTWTFKKQVINGMDSGGDQLFIQVGINLFWLYGPNMRRLISSPKFILTKRGVSDYFIYQSKAHHVMHKTVPQEDE